MVEQPAVNRLVVGSNPTSGASFFSCFSRIFLRILTENFISGIPMIWRSVWPTITARTRLLENSHVRMALGSLFGPNLILLGRLRPKESEKSNRKNRRDGFENNCSMIESRRVGINRLVVGSNPTSGAICLMTESRQPGITSRLQVQSCFWQPVSLHIFWSYL
jgi:hypothetical protein